MEPNHAGSLLNDDRSVDIDAAFEEGTPIDEALNEAVMEAIERHRQAGVPIVVWQDGKTVEIMPPDSNAGEKSER